MQVQVKSLHIPELLEVAEWPQSQYLQNNLHNVHWTWGEGLGGERLGGERLGGERLGGERLGGERLGGERLGGERLGGEGLGGECECVLAAMQEMLCVCV